MSSQIDPPYNTGSAFEHYDDGLEHSIWLSLMRDRLVLLRKLLSEDGSIWITIDDNEAHYLKVLCDEVFGRGSFIASNIWQKRYSRENREAIGDAHDYVLTYAINPEKFKLKRNLLMLGEKQHKLYKNPNNDPRGTWQSVSLLAQGYRGRKEARGTRRKKGCNGRSFQWKTMTKNNFVSVLTGYYA